MSRAEGLRNLDEACFDALEYGYRGWESLPLGGAYATTKNTEAASLTDGWPRYIGAGQYCSDICLQLS